MAETRVDGDGPQASAAAEVQLRAEAQMFGFAEGEISSARCTFAGDPPNQP